MRTIAIANQKGGVGKTTLTAHLGAYLARKGRTVALVDTDPQGNLTSWATGGDTTLDGLFQLLVVGQPALTLALPVDAWGVRLLPGNYRTGEAFVFLAATGKPFDTVAQMIAPLARSVDYCLLDMPPSRGAGFREVLFAADWLLVPVQLERLALEGLAFMRQTCVEIAAQHGRAPRLLGVVPNMTRRQTTEHQDQMRQLLATLGPVVWPPVPLSVKVAEACSYGQLLFDYAPREAVTRAISVVGDRLIENLEAADEQSK